MDNEIKYKMYLRKSVFKLNNKSSAKTIVIYQKFLCKRKEKNKRKCDIKIMIWLLTKEI